MEFPLAPRPLAEAGLAGRLMGCVHRGGGAALPLVFEALDLTRGERTADRDSLLKDEMAALDEQRRSQTALIPAQMEAARREARAQAREEWEDELEQHVAEERTKAVRTCEQFARERVKYFAAVEGQVVGLALAVAARVLHREASLDPLLLLGVVRVALERVADDSTVVLRVPACDEERWREAFDESVERPPRVEVDPVLRAGECCLDTSVGKVELGIAVQLEEIEKGFFDLLQQRPA